MIAIPPSSRDLNVRYCTDVIVTIDLTLSIIIRFLLPRLICCRHTGTSYVVFGTWRCDCGGTNVPGLWCIGSTTRMGRSHLFNTAWSYSSRNVDLHLTPDTRYEPWKGRNALRTLFGLRLRKYSKSPWQWRNDLLPRITRKVKLKKENRFSRSRKRFSIKRTDNALHEMVLAEGEVETLWRTKCRNFGQPCRSISRRVASSHSSRPLCSRGRKAYKMATDQWCTWYFCVKLLQQFPPPIWH